MDKGSSHLELSITPLNKNNTHLTFRNPRFFLRSIKTSRGPNLDDLWTRWSKSFLSFPQIAFYHCTLTAFFYKRIFKLFFFFWYIPLFLLSGCVTSDERTLSPKRATSRPYVINNQLYTPQHHYELTETGIASHYGGPDGCHGTPTATGERFSMFELTAAHKTLPLPCIVLVENLENGKSLKLKVNDRGPFIGDRILDVSVEAAKQLGFYEKGLAQVRITTLVEDSIALCASKNYKKRNFLVCESPRPKKLVPACYLSQQVDQVLAQSPRKIYVSVRAPSLGRALEIEEKLKYYGQTNLRKVHQNAPLHVTVGPFSTVASAQQVQQELSDLYPSILIHE